MVFFLIRGLLEYFCENEKKIKFGERDGSRGKPKSHAKAYPPNGCRL